jgi:NADH-quinone oxidoreductase subunit M
MGLPGLSGFISEVLVLLGSWQKFPVLAIIGASGVILTAGYLLWTIQRVYLGPLNEKYKSLPEINGREMFTLVPLGAIVILVGVYPNVVLDLLRASLDHINQIVLPHLHS